MASETSEKIEMLKSLRLASPISAFTFWHFELASIAEDEGLPLPLYGDMEPLFKAGLTPRAAATKLAKRYA